MFVLGSCDFPNPFFFISSNPYEALWQATAFCGLLLLIMTIFLFARSKSSLLVTLTLVTSVIAFTLAIIAGRQASIGLDCAGAPGISPTYSQQAETNYHILRILEIAGIAIFLLTVTLFVLDGRILFKSILGKARQEPTV